MSDKINDIVIPILKNIQADVSELKSDVSVLKEAVRRIDSRISTMDSYMAGFHGSLNWQNSEIDHLRGRVEGLEDKDPDQPH